LARPVQRSFDAFDDTTFDETPQITCDSMMQRDYRYDASGLQASSQRHEAAEFSGGRPRPLPEEWRDK
jgi:hypothetical protein